MAPSPPTRDAHARNAPRLVKLTSRSQVVEWLAPVRLLARLDTPRGENLAIEGNLRLEGWAFCFEPDGQVQQPRLVVRSHGRPLACAPLAVARPDVNAGYGLAADTVPLGFRFLLAPLPEAGQISLHVEHDAGSCTLAWIDRRPAGDGFETLVAEVVQARGPLKGLQRPGEEPQRPGQEAQRQTLLAALAEGSAWDGSQDGSLQAVMDGLERDLALVQQLLQRQPDSSQASAMLVELARRYGLPLTQRIMATLNQIWLFPHELEFGRHGLQRSFRFWSFSDKAAAMATSSAALRRWQAEGIACFHSFGTLLGLVREGDLLDHDDDIDAVAIVPLGEGETPEQATAALERRLRNLGHQTQGDYRFHRHVEHDGLWFDIFIATLRGEEITFYGTRIWTAPLQAVLPLQQRTIGGLDCVLPAQPEQIVEGLYGRSWRTPSACYYTGIQRALGMGSHASELINGLDDQPAAGSAAVDPPG